MTSNKLLRSGAFLFLMLCIAFFVFSIGLNREDYERVALGGVTVYLLKQLVALLLLFVLGLAVSAVTFHGCSMEVRILLALPTACLLWAGVSLVVLMCGIPYRLFTTLFGIAFVIAILWLAWGKTALANIISCMGSPLLLVLLGLVVFCAGGLVYSFVSYDSFFYFINYGHSLAITGNFRDLLGDNAYTMTNIGQFLPMLCAYMSFFGVDQPYALQALLGGNMLLFFFFVLYERQQKLEKRDRRSQLIYPLAFTAILATSTSYVIISGWMLANMYCMVYILCGFGAYCLYEKGLMDIRDYMLATTGSYVALVLTRKDGIIFAVFCFICLVCKEVFGRGDYTRYLMLVMPAAGVEAFWLFYIRVILGASVKQSSLQSVANNKNIVFIICIVLGAISYLCFFHRLIRGLLGWLPLVEADGQAQGNSPGKAQEKKAIKAETGEYLLLMTGLVLLLLIAQLLKRGTYYNGIPFSVIDNIDFTIRNMFQYPSAWGVSGLIMGVLLVLSLLHRPGLDMLHFFWMGYALMNLVSYSIVDSKALWVNWDDSYSRVLMQIVPVYLLVMAIKIYPLLEDKSMGRNIG